MQALLLGALQCCGSSSRSSPSPPYLLVSVNSTYAAYCRCLQLITHMHVTVLQGVVASLLSVYLTVPYASLQPYHVVVECDACSNTLSTAVHSL